MNIKQQALGGFSKERDEIVLVKGRTVLLAMTGNANFENPDPALETVEQVLDNYEEKLALAKRRGSMEDTAAKNKARKVVEQLLKRLAFYVTHIADGDLSMLLSSGFSVSSLPKREDVPDTITGVTLRDGKQKGQMRMDFDKNPAAKIYEYQVGRVDDQGMVDEWSEMYLTTSSKFHIIAPLEPYRRYAVRVRALNGYGRSDWSALVSHVVR